MAVPPGGINFNNLDLNLLRVFDIIMQERNLTRAAERLGKSVAGTSHALRRLRDELKDELFETPGRGMIPTRRALEIAPAIRECLASLRHGITAEPMFEPGTARRIFTIDIPVGGDCVIAGPLMAHIERVAPRVSIRILSDRAMVLRSELRYGETDLGIDHEQVDGDGLKSELLYDDALYLLTRRGHPLVPAGTRVTAKLYGRLKHLGVSWTRTKGDSPLTHGLTRLGIEREFGMLVPTVGAVPGIIESTDLVIALSQRVARHFVKRWAIDIHPLEIGLDRIPLYLVWHDRNDKDPGHLWLRGAMRTAVAAI